MNPTPTKPNRWRPITVFNLLIGLLFSLSALGQPPFLKESLVAYYPFNGNADDASGNGNNGTLLRGIFISDRFGNSSKALQNLLPVPNWGWAVDTGITSQFSSNFTLSVWFNHTSPNDSILIAYGNSGVVDPYIAVVPNLIDYRLRVGKNLSLSDSQISDGKWHLMVATCKNGVASLYFDGNLVKKESDSTPTAYSGQSWKLAPGPCSLDDVRIYNRALADTEVKALYDYESTPPNNNFITNGLVAYYPFNGNANDESGNSYNGQLIAGTFAPNRFDSQNGTLDLNGDNQYVSIPDFTAIDNAEQATFSCWIKSPAIGNKSDTVGNPIFMRWLSGGSYAGAVGLIAGETKGMVTTAVIGGFGTESQTAPMVSDQWQQMVIVFDGRKINPSERLKYYVNGADGVFKDYAAANPSRLGAVGTVTYIGRYAWSPISFKGKIDDVRIYNRALSDGEVKALYNYESTPPQNNINPRTANATAQVVNGFVVGAEITDGGYGYVSNPVVAITGGGGTGAKAMANQLNGVVTGITIINPGSGYTSTPTITIAPPPFPPRKATSTAQVVNGFVVGTKITDGGFGYDSPPAVLLVGGGGSGATAVATVANGVVTAITIINSGSGYTSAPSIQIASPPFAPSLDIEISRVSVRLKVVLGRKYQLEASTDLKTWASTGPAFVAQAEELAQEFDVNQVGRYFRINQVP